jgi:hypothetical protein
MKINYLESRFKLERNAIADLAYSGEVQNIYNLLKTKTDMIMFINYLQHARHITGIYHRWSYQAWIHNIISR